MLRPAHRPAAACLLAAALVACGGDDPVAPVATFPIAAARLTAVADSLEPIARPEALAWFVTMRFPAGLPMDDPFVDGFVPVRGSVDVAAERPAGQYVLPPLTIPDSLRGRTFVRDTAPGALGRWRLDTVPGGAARPGAPPTGVRFMLDLYVPLGAARQRVGHMDVAPGGPQADAPLFVAVTDTARRLVLGFRGWVADRSGDGSVSAGGAVIRQTVARSGRRVVSRWSSSGTVALDARRDGDFGDVVHTMTLDGRRLQLRRAQVVQRGSFPVWNYTVLVDGAPFATRRESFEAVEGWRHVKDDRPLTEAELRQVQAFVRVLRAIPDAHAAWSEGERNLRTLIYGTIF